MRILIDKNTKVITGTCNYAVDPATLESSNLEIGSIPDDKYTDSVLGSIMGDDGQILPPPKQWSEVRARRNGALSNSDWTQMPDSPLSSEKKQEWATWRQQLRDIPNNNQTPDEADSAITQLIESMPQNNS